MKPVILCACLLGFAAAQETCESLVDGLQQTLERTQTLTRTVQVKAGFLQLMSNTSLVKRTAMGVEVILLEHSGRQPDPSRASANVQSQEGWLGAMNLDDLSCDGHSLEVTGDSGYKLELIDHDEASPVQGVRLNFLISEPDNYFLKSFQASLKAADMPFALTIIATIDDWQLQ